MSIIQVRDGTEWDQFIRESPSSTPFHRWDALNTIAKYTEYKAYPYGIYRDNVLIGAIPLFIKMRKGFKEACSPPSTKIANITYMGYAVCADYDDLNACDKEGYWRYLAEETAHLLNELSVDYVSIALYPGHVDMRSFIHCGFELEVHFTYILDLKPPLEKIWIDLEHRVKKGIERTQQTVTLRPSNDTDAFFSLMRDRLKGQGETFYHIQDPSYIKELISAFPQDFKMRLLIHEDTPVGAMVTSVNKNMYVFWMCGGVMEGLNITEYMTWEVIKEAKAEGYTWFENCGADEKRLNPFKSQFNLDPVPYIYLVKKSVRYRIAEIGYGGAIGLMKKMKRV